MTTPVFPLFYFGPITYYAALVKHRAVTWELMENFPKRTYRNRCILCGPNGPQNNSVPVQKWKSGSTKTGEIELSLVEAWPHEHWNTIKAGYGRSPFFEHYAPYLEPLFKVEPQSLTNFSIRTTTTVLELLGHPLKTELSTTYEKVETNLDFRSRFEVDKHLLLRQLPADNNPHSLPKYLQVFSDRLPFIPNLSILDLLFNEGPNSLPYLQKLENP